MAAVLVGRDRLVAEVGGAGRVVVVGPWGVGRTALLRAVGGRARERVLWVGQLAGDRAVPYSGVVSLLAGVPEAHVAELAGPRRRVISGLLRRADSPWDVLAVRLAVTELLGRTPTLLLIDDAQWLDAASVQVLAYALSASEDVRAVVAERESSGVGRALCGVDVARVVVPPLGVGEVAELLGEYRLPARWAPRVHRICGGNPRLVTAAAEELAAGSPAPRPGRPPVVPARALGMAVGWLGTLSRAARRTLLVAALAERPDRALLRRAGRLDADAHIDEAKSVGLVIEAGPVRFAAELLAEAVVRAADVPQRRAAHAALAAAVTDPVHAVRHRVLAADGFDAGLAEQAERMAGQARGDGQRRLAAELTLLAAERTPERSARLRRLAQAAEDAGAGGSTELARRVAEQVRAARGGPGEQVAALLAMADAGGQALHEMEDVLARAAAVAGGDPVLSAAVQLRVAVKANICEGDPRRARAVAARSAELAQKGGDRAGQAMALTMRARMERIVGDERAARTLAAALALGVPADVMGVQRSPQYLAARHAVFDDRLDEAREHLMELLPVAERRGDAEDLEEVLRSLAEVDARRGACARALEWSERAIGVCSAAGLSPGPVWYTAALAESAGGSFTRATEHARRAVRASREEHDVVFASRSLLALGVVELVTGSPRQAVGTLRQVAELEAEQQVADVRMLRWQPELIEALAVGGNVDEAGELLDRLGTVSGGVAAAADRARALCLVYRGEADEGMALLERSAESFGDLGLAVEQGRTLLTAGRVERGRRRAAAARSCWQRAAELFDELGARPWSRLADGLLTPSRRVGGVALTEAEERLAALVVAGASNQEAARKMFISVKTVEAMLSRIYRKLGVRSRTQLAAVRYEHRL